MQRLDFGLWIAGFGGGHGLELLSEWVGLLCLAGELGLPFLITDDFGW